MRSLFRKIIVTYTAATVACMVVVAAFWTTSFKHQRYRGLEQSLAAEASVLRELVNDGVLAGTLSADDAHLKRLGTGTGARITILAASGQALFDSHENAGVMENHAHRPEVVAARESGTGRAVRSSPTLDREMMYYCEAIYRPGGREIAGYLRLALSAGDIAREVRGACVAIWLACGAGVGLSLLAGIMLMHRITRPLKALRNAAERLKTGDLDTPIRGIGNDDISQLAELLDGTRETMRSTLARYEEAAGRLEAVIADMAGGVIVVDERATLILANEEARRLLRLPAECLGQPLAGFVRSPELLNLMQLSHDGRQPVNREITIPGPAERTIDARIAPVIDTSRAFRGTVAMLLDVTELRRLEQIRSDFVANVSHELKSPLTSIRGFVETLRDGAYRNERDALHFIGILDKETRRLENIVEDLLSLSEIEAKESRIVCVPVNLNDIASQAAADFRVIAGDHKVQVVLNLSSRELVINADANLLGRAVDNLVDNAIKYNQAGGTVTISTAREAGAAVLRVSDTGIGIPSKDLPRIFERFYRVDKSHSRRLGGTGLGLSIAKHIIAAHAGSIAVQSELGKGSEFVVTFPVQSA